jgi:hypothetical protein
MTPSAFAFPLRHRHLALAALLLAGVAGIAWRSPRAEPGPSAAPAVSDVHLRYADARLKLARLDLEKALRQNKAANAPQVPESDIRRLELRVGALERQVEAIRTDPEGKLDGGQIARAEAVAALAREDLARLERIRAASPIAVAEIDVDRGRAKVEIAELRVELWKDPAHLISVTDRVQIQIDQLTDILIDLLDDIENRRTVSAPP